MEFIMRWRRNLGFAIVTAAGLLLVLANIVFSQESEPPFPVDACAFRVLAMVAEQYDVQLVVFEDATAIVVNDGDADREAVDIVEWINGLDDDIRMQHGCA